MSSAGSGMIELSNHNRLGIQEGRAFQMAGEYSVAAQLEKSYAFFEH